MKMTMTKLSEYLMVGITITVLLLGVLWVEGFFYIGKLLTIAAAVALFIYFWPFIVQKFNFDDEEDYEDDEAEDDEKAVSEEETVEENKKKPPETAPIEEKIENVELEKSEATEEKVESFDIEKMEEEYTVNLKVAENALKNGDFAEAEEMISKAEELDKKIKFGKAKEEEERKEALRVQKENELRSRLEALANK